MLPLLFASSSCAFASICFSVSSYLPYCLPYLPRFFFKPPVSLSPPALLHRTTVSRTAALAHSSPKKYPLSLSLSVQQWGSPSLAALHCWLCAAQWSQCSSAKPTPRVRRSRLKVALALTPHVLQCALGVNWATLGWQMVIAAFRYCVLQALGVLCVMVTTTSAVTHAASVMS